MSNRYKILVIEDENAICGVIRAVLDTDLYHVLTANTCRQGISMFCSHMPDLVILDLGLPDQDGLEVIRQIRKNNTVPIVVLSARSLEADKVSALDLGADDYITKPFGTAELKARVRAALRGRRMGGDYGNVGGTFILQDLTIDYDRRQITVGEEEIKLTNTEYKILELLSLQAGKVLTYSVIIGKIWGLMDESSVKRLQVNMANIRRKLGSKPGNNSYIVNELGVGYRMREPSAE